jgi:DNA polymerase-1
MPKKKKRLIIIDGNALLHRSFHAIPTSLRTKKGLLVNAAYGFASFLLKALAEFRPDYAVLTLDRKEATFRHKSYEGYKATRVKAPDELYEQLPIIKDLSAAFSIPVYELAGYEADDLIGTICKLNSQDKNLEKIIITGDLDTLQLVDENTKVYTMSRGLNDSLLYGREEVFSRLGVYPEYVIDYKGLRGDTSDNLPGVRGIGEKTASNLLQEFQDLDGVYKALEKNSAKISPRIKKLLEDNRDNAYLSRQLATIDCAAPFDFSLEKADFHDFQLENITKLFSELEFRSLLNKAREINNIFKGDNAGAQETINNKEEKSEYLPAKDQKEYWSELEKAPLIAVSLKTTGDSWVIALAKDNKKSLYFSQEKNEYDFLKKILGSNKISKAGHNLKDLIKILKKSSLDLEGELFDIEIADYLLHPGNREHGLNNLAFSLLGQELLHSQEKNRGEQLSLIATTNDSDKSALAASEEACLIFQISAMLKKELEEDDLLEVFQKIEMPLTPVLAKMEIAGIKLDLKKLSGLEKEVGQRLAALENSIYAEAGERFNINSPKQLQVILFDKLAIPTGGIKKTKTGLSTAEEELEKLAGQHAIIPFLQEYRELNKLQTTYIQALPGLVDHEDGRIHSHFKQTVAATGRLSSTEPNLQNIPIRSKEGDAIRAAFVPEKGFVFLGFDYSQIELRLAAHLSGDKKLIAAFQEGQDIHTATAAEINDVTIEEVDKKMRREAKAINFGIIYGQGPHGLSASAGIPYFKALEFIDKYFESYPSVKKMMEKSIEAARKDGFVKTMFGRKRPLSEINSNIVGVRKMAERMAINTPLQGSAADIIKLAMIAIDRLISGQENDIRLILQIHDELIFEIRQEALTDYQEKIKNLMENVCRLRVPIIVEGGSGQNWSLLK